MNNTDFSYIFNWWGVLFFAGIFFLPLTAKIFPQFSDKGYAFSKILGVIIVSYIAYVLSVLHILPFTTLSIYGITFLTASILLLFKNNLKQFLNKKVFILFIFEELLFLFGLLFWSYVRSFNPDIYGLEKFMDFGFVNSILRSSYLPPVDMWYPPFSINYYYFGHYITALLTKSTNIPSLITFNLMIATLFALTLTESFSLGMNVLSSFQEQHKQKFFRFIFGGLLIACLITFAGNLHILYSFFKTYDADKPVPLWQLEFSFFNPCYHQETYIKTTPDGKQQTIACTKEDQERLYTYPNSYWYPNATRFIYHTIHEFPIYSWVVADLHGHVLDIPMVILTIAVLFSFFVYLHDSHLSKSVNDEVKKLSKRNYFSELFSQYGRFIFLGFLIAIMYMTNAWDGLTYLMLTAIILGYLQWDKISKDKNILNPLFQIIPKTINLHKTKILLEKHFLIDLFTGVVFYLLIIVFSFFVFSRPFSANFSVSKIVSGIGVVGAPSFLLERKTVNQAGMYGNDQRNLFIKLLIPDHCKSLMSPDDQKLVTTQYDVRKIGPFLFEPDHCLRSPWWQLLILYGFFYFFVFAFLLSLRKKESLQKTDSFILILITTATILIILPEFFYMKDIYPDHYRANTMFKLVFQAFIMLSLASGYIIMRTLSKQNLNILRIKQKILYVTYLFTTVGLLSLVFIYPYFAINSYYGGITEDINSMLCRSVNPIFTFFHIANNDRNKDCSTTVIRNKGLDGLKYLKDKFPGDYEAINWLNNNVHGQPVVLEAQGDSYTDYERISANTGLPTILGWYVHEWLWRGIDAPKARAGDVQKIYESVNIQEVKNLLNQYNVQYVLIGTLESQKYLNISEDKFKTLGKIVFQSGGTKIYKLN